MSDQAFDDLGAAHRVAMSERRFADAFEITLAACLQEGLRILRTEYQIEWQAPPIGGYAPLRDLVVDLDHQFDAQGEPSPKALHTRHMLAALRDAMALLEDLDEEARADPSLFTAKFGLVAIQLGHWAALSGLSDVGLWDDFGSARWKLDRIGAGRRGVQPDWQVAFLPVAIAHCEGRASVGLAELRRRARQWADQERAHGRNPGLPATDKGIDDGIKRMEASGRLRIPGRSGG